MIKGIGEKLVEGIGLLGGVHSLLETFEKMGKVHEGLPPIIKAKLPGFLGLSLADEQIFNGVLGQLGLKDQIVITNFLKVQCKDYERNRFINIVAGMEVVETAKKEEGFDDNSKKVTKTKIESGGKKDKREDFLRSFAKIITTKFNNDLRKAYDFCIGGRMIIPDPMHQKALCAFSESLKWFKTTKWSASAITACKKATAKLRSTSIGKKYKGFWSAAFPKKRWAIAFGIFATVVTVMLVGGLISS